MAISAGQRSRRLVTGHGRDGSGFAGRVVADDLGPTAETMVDASAIRSDELGRRGRTSIARRFRSSWRPWQTEGHRPRRSRCGEDQACPHDKEPTHRGHHEDDGRVLGPAVTRCYLVDVGVDDGQDGVDARGEERDVEAEVVRTRRVVEGFDTGDQHRDQPARCGVRAGPSRY